MGYVILTLQVLPETPETDLESVKEEVKKIIEGSNGKVSEERIEPFVFGLKKLILKFVYPEEGFNEEELIKKIEDVSGVQSAEIIGVTRSIA